MWVMNQTITLWLDSYRNDQSAILRKDSVARTTPINRVATHMFYKVRAKPLGMSLSYGIFTVMVKLAVR